jgi:hypothetical protein
MIEIKKQKTVNKLDTNALYEAIIQSIVYRNPKADNLLIVQGILAWLNSYRGSIPYIGYLADYKGINIFDRKNLYTTNTEGIKELVNTLFYEMFKIWQTSNGQCRGLAFQLREDAKNPRMVIAFTMQFVKFKLYSLCPRMKAGVTFGSTHYDSIHSCTNLKKNNLKEKFKLIESIIKEDADERGIAYDEGALQNETILKLEHFGFAPELLVLYRVSKYGIEKNNVYLSDDMSSKLVHIEEQNITDKFFTGDKASDLLLMSDLTFLEKCFVGAFFHIPVALQYHRKTEYVKMDWQLFFNTFPEYRRIFVSERIKYSGGRPRKSYIPANENIIKECQLYKTVIEKLKKGYEKLSLEISIYDENFDIEE